MTQVFMNRTCEMPTISKKELDDYRQLSKASNFQPNTFNSIFLNAGMTVYSISLLKKVY